MFNEINDRIVERYTQRLNQPIKRTSKRLQAKRDREIDEIGKKVSDDALKRSRALREDAFSRRRPQLYQSLITDYLQNRVHELSLSGFQTEADTLTRAINSLNDGYRPTRTANTLASALELIAELQPEQAEQFVNIVEADNLIQLANEADEQIFPAQAYDVDAIDDYINELAYELLYNEQNDLNINNNLMNGIAKIIHPRVAKGVVSVDATDFGPVGTYQSISAQLAAGISASLSGQLWGGMQEAGARIKRINISFVAPEFCWYDKVTATEYALIVSSSNTLLSSQMTQMPTTYESIVHRLPYEKERGNVVSFSFSGLAAAQDSFLCIFGSALDSSAIGKLKFNIEFQVYFEYPRTSSAKTLKKRIQQIVPNVVVANRFKSKRSYKSKPKKRSNMRRKYRK